MSIEAKRTLSDVAPENSFKTKAGKELRNLEELLHNLREMDTKTFSHHVNETKNDFEKWVKDVVKDNTLADELAETKDQLEMERIVRNRIIQLKEAIDKYEESFKKDEEVIEEQQEVRAKKRYTDATNDEEDEANSVDSLKYFINKHLIGIAIGTIIGLIIGFILGNI
ncbi:hypothetical protein HZA96_00535 [Candidatus Woesearchaeota archaeon]|nr:hypothetical protein [Candidatus Woesearchaeota archaeon]